MCCRCTQRRWSFKKRFSKRGARCGTFTRNYSTCSRFFFICLLLRVLFEYFLNSYHNPFPSFKKTFQPNHNTCCKLLQNVDLKRRSISFLLSLLQRLKEWCRDRRVYCVRERRRRRKKEPTGWEAPSAPFSQESQRIIVVVVVLSSKSIQLTTTLLVF